MNNLHRYIKSTIKEYGGQVNAIYYCPYHKDGKIKQPNKESFMVDYLEMDKNSWKNFNNTGIRKIYYRLLELLEKAYPKC